MKGKKQICVSWNINAPCIGYWLDIAKYACSRAQSSLGDKSMKDPFFHRDQVVAYFII